MDNADVVIDASGLYKRFCRKHKLSVRYAVRDMFAEAIRGQQEVEHLRLAEFWAVENVSFKLKRGESLGLIGTNGSGKTTLLKMVSGILRPDRGVIHKKKRVVALFAKGLGFDTILSGRENISINLAMLGLSNAEIKRTIDSVIDFAELPVDALDAPLKGYSSGMLARLSFSCAINTNPDIMFIDEALAVGDFRFRNKCYKRLTEMRKTGVSFVLVSHGLNTIIANCDVALYMSSGQMVSYGNSRQVVGLYEEHLLTGENAFQPVSIVSEMENHRSLSDVRLINILFLNNKGEKIEHLSTGEEQIIRVEAESGIDIEKLHLSLIVRDLDGQYGRLLALDTFADKLSFNVKAGKFYYDVKLNPCGLRPGLYAVKIIISSGLSQNILDAVESFRFKVKASKEITQSLYYQSRSWSVTQPNASE